MMKVVGVISSAKAQGSSAALLREALRGAENAGAEVSELFLPRYRIEFCNGCGACLAAGRCAIADDFEAVKAVLAEADGIILSSPTYGSAPCARIKNLFDRLGQLAFLSSFVGGKYVAAIATAGSVGVRKTARELAAISQASVLQRSRLSGTLGVKLHGKHASELPSELAAARALGRKVALDIRSRRAYPLKGVYDALVRKGALAPAA
jgi:multimeric flavodoxin WrbA